jgi:hypothetical protein
MQRREILPFSRKVNPSKGMQRRGFFPFEKLNPSKGIHKKLLLLSAYS